MLVLSRKKCQNIVIFDPANPAYRAVVSVVEIKGDKVRIGVKAERHIKVHRQEVHDAIQQESQAA